MVFFKFPVASGRLGPGVDVVLAERWGAMLAGGSLMLFGLSRRNSAGLALVAGGAGLIAKSLIGAGGFQTTAPEPGRVSVERAVVVQRPVAEIYHYWRDFTNLPQVMSHLVAVEVLDDRRSRWTAKAPLGGQVAWDAEIVGDRPNERIAWRSLPDADVPNSGDVTFRSLPGDLGTEVVVRLRYEPPAVGLGRTVAKIAFEEPDQQVRDDLRRFKATMETGEAPTTVGQSSGREHLVE